MRISDWSSDVCSSDLQPDQRGQDCPPGSDPVVAPAEADGAGARRQVQGDAEDDDLREPHPEGACVVVAAYGLPLRHAVALDHVHDHDPAHYRYSFLYGTCFSFSFYFFFLLFFYSLFF